MKQPGSKGKSPITANDSRFLFSGCTIGMQNIESPNTRLGCLSTASFCRELEPSSFNNFLEEPPACVAAHSTPYDTESSIRSSSNLARGELDEVTAVVLDELEAGRRFRQCQSIRKRFEDLITLAHIPQIGLIFFSHT